MPLTPQPGDEVGHDRILEPLGQGGLGENILAAGAVSRDGRIALVRGTSTADVALVRGK